MIHDGPGRPRARREGADAARRRRARGELAAAGARAHESRSRRRSRPTRSRDVIVINRSTQPPVRSTTTGSSAASFPVATGQAIYPTPRGTFHIVVKWNEPVVVPADLERLGAGAEARAARARQPARHALDGHLEPRRRHPRHRRARPRSATAPRTAASGCRCPTPNGCSTTSTSARRSTSSDARSFARRRRRRPSSACWGCSSGTSRTAAARESRRRSTRARSCAAPKLDLPRLDADGRLSLASLRGKVVVVNFWESYCVPCKQEAQTRRRRRALLERARASSSSGVNAFDTKGAARAYLEALRRRLRRTSATASARRSATGASPAFPRRSSSTGAAAWCRRTSSGLASRQELDDGIRLALSVVRAARRRRGGARARGARGGLHAAREPGAPRDAARLPSCHTTLDESDSEVAREMKSEVAAAHRRVPVREADPRRDGRRVRPDDPLDAADTRLRPARVAPAARWRSRSAPRRLRSGLGAGRATRTAEPPRAGARRARRRGRAPRRRGARTLR